MNIVQVNRLLLMGMRIGKLLKLENFRKRICSLLFFILLSSIIPFSQVNSIIDYNNLYEIPMYVSREPITISSLSDIEKYGIPGEGTMNNPYKIENYKIITEDYACIRIIGVKKFFLVRNCYLSAKAYGVDVQDILYGGYAVIESNNIVNCNAGITIISSPNTVIKSNTFENNSHSAVIVDYNSFKTKIENNICKLYGGGGINIKNSINCSLLDNVFYDYSDIENYELYDDAIYLFESNGCLLENNRIYNNGININDWQKEDFLSHNFANNFVNDKKFGYFKDLENNRIDSVEYGQIYLIGCKNVTVANQEINNTTLSIFSTYCNNCLIENCNFSYNKVNAIRIRFTNQLNVSNCNISFNPCSAFFSWNCSDSKIVSNLVYLNKNSGLHLSYSHNFKIANNLFQQNGAPGIDLFSSSYNIIHHNTFYNNSLEETINAYDFKQFNWYSSNNTWYDIYSTEGNYWDNANETGSYQIPGNHINYDFYPLLEPTVEKIEGLIYLWNTENDNYFTAFDDKKTSYHFISIIVAMFILVYSLKVKIRKHKINLK